jgi:hypothetical protein
MLIDVPDPDLDLDPGAASALSPQTMETMQCWN